MNKILFLDRDGVINVDRSYVYKIEDFQWMPGIFDGLRVAAAKGYVCIIVTNQSGIARGYYTEDEAKVLEEYIRSCFLKEGITLLDYYYCPHLVGAPLAQYNVDCDCRKPKPGMILRAIEEHDCDIENSFMIGDKPRDVEAAERAGIKGYLFTQGNVGTFISNIINQ